MNGESIVVLVGGRRGAATLPLVTVDMDGVLSMPLFGWNATALGPVAAPEGPHPRSRLKRWLWRSEAVRYAGRRSMPGAAAFLLALAPHFRLILVTARGAPAAAASRRWLRRGGLWPYLDGLVFRTDPHQPSYAYKAAAVAALAAAWHVDDDGRTALHVHRRTGRPVVLIAWKQNAGEYPEGVYRVPDLAAAARFLMAQPDETAR